MPHMDGYSTFDIRNILGIPQERLQDWLKKDFLTPSVPARGQGTKALFDIFDLYGIALFQHLVMNIRLRREEAKNIVAGWLSNTRGLIKEGYTGKEQRYIPLYYYTRARDRWNPTGTVHLSRLGHTTTVSSGDINLEVLSFPVPQSTNPNKHLEAMIRAVNEVAVKRRGGWDDIFILNIGNIMEAVDAALARQKK